MGGDPSKVAANGSIAGCFFALRRGSQRSSPKEMPVCEIQREKHRGTGGRQALRIEEEEAVDHSEVFPAYIEAKQQQRTPSANRASRFEVARLGTFSQPSEMSYYAVSRTLPILKNLPAGQLLPHTCPLQRVPWSRPQLFCVQL